MLRWVRPHLGDGAGNKSVGMSCEGVSSSVSNAVVDQFGNESALARTSCELDDALLLDRGVELRDSRASFRSKSSDMDTNVHAEGHPHNGLELRNS